MLDDPESPRLKGPGDEVNTETPSPQIPLSGASLLERLTVHRSDVQLALLVKEKGKEITSTWTEADADANEVPSE